MNADRKGERAPDWPDCFPASAWRVFSSGPKACFAGTEMWSGVAGRIRTDTRDSHRSLRAPCPSSCDWRPRTLPRSCIGKPPPFHAMRPEPDSALPSPNRSAKEPSAYSLTWATTPYQRRFREYALVRSQRGTKRQGWAQILWLYEYAATGLSARKPPTRPRWCRKEQLTQRQTEQRALFISSRSPTLTAPLQPALW